MKYILAFILAVSSLTANAGSLYLGGWSKHFGGSTDNDGYVLNENHQMVAIEYNNIFAGTMINSYHTRSYLLGYQLPLIEDDRFNLDIAVGGVYGYKEEQLKVLRIGNMNGFGSLILEFNTPYVKPVVMLFGEAFVLNFKYEF